MKEIMFNKIFSEMVHESTQGGAQASVDDRKLEHHGIFSAASSYF